MYVLRIDAAGEVDFPGYAAHSFSAPSVANISSGNRSAQRPRRCSGRAYAARSAIPSRPVLQAHLREKRVGGRQRRLLPIELRFQPLPELKSRLKAQLLPCEPNIGGGVASVAGCRSP